MAESRLRIAVAQTNLVVGDVAGNTASIIGTAQRARDEHAADLVVFPELALTGYPPEDLLLRPGLYRQADAAVEDICRRVRGIHMVIGFPLREAGRIYNACSLLHDGRSLLTYRKQHLPNYSVFDEKRYFQPGALPVEVFSIKSTRVAISICEDLWEPGTARQAAERDARILLNINASPYHVGKPALRERMLAANVEEGGMPIVYANLVGGQDELVFDGHSLVMDSDKRIVQRWPHCREVLGIIEFESGACVSPAGAEPPAPPGEEEAVYEVLVLGIRDYIDKNGFRGAVVGVSGGIDSALTLALAVDALGPARVHAVAMPSRYTAGMSIEDAEREARALGVEFRVIPIEPVVRAINQTMAGEFAGLPADITEENIQARCRGIILMAISNKKGLMVLTTGNKSEMSVGYATLYGDMAGGFAPLKDVSKLLVYRLAEWRNRRGPIIPRRVIERAPTAELAPGQKDEDSLPPYAILDPILERYIERDQSPAEIVAAGFPPEVVARVARLVDRAEYKRRQAPPGVRITQRAFGKDRRYPITSGYTELDRR
jgi:NAD+ synthase (glutamine-hydrolysing)